MTYKGRIGVDMTGGDTAGFVPILDRTIKYLREAAEKHADYQFFAAGPKKQLQEAGFPSNVEVIDAPETRYIDIKQVTPEHNNGNTPLHQLFKYADNQGLDVIISHAKAKAIQENTMRNSRDPDSSGLEKIPEIARPALVAMVPAFYRVEKTRGLVRRIEKVRVDVKNTIVLDVGANYQNKPLEMHQFAHLGKLCHKYFPRFTKDVKSRNPTVAILNMCEESDFGPEKYRQLYQALEADENIHFVGNMETRHVLGIKPHVYNSASFVAPDVLLTEGFVGNMMIKMFTDFADWFSLLLKDGMFPETNLAISPLYDIRALTLAGVKKRMLEEQVPQKKFGGALFAPVWTRDKKSIVFIKGRGEADEGILHGINRGISYHEAQVTTNINQDLGQILREAELVRKADLKRMRA